VRGPTKGRFEEIFSSGKRVSGSICRLSALPGQGKVGIATSKKIGSNPRRNRIKRRFREALRKLDLADQNLDHVLVVLPSAEDATAEEIRQDLVKVFGHMAERWANESASS
jgi:ribonuclease P protein component